MLRRSRKIASRFSFTLLLIALLVQLGLPVKSLATGAAVTPLKVGFLFVGPINDMGWNYEQNRARLFVESALGPKVQTEYVESLAESGEAERVIEKMIAHGTKLIFGTSFGYLEPILRCAAKHPDVIFMQLNRFSDLKNVGTFTARHDEPMYIAGVVAGRMTKANKIGFVASRPVPSTFMTLDGFALGVHSVNPKAKINVVWTNQWIDPPTEAEAAKGLIESGVDLLGFDQSESTTIVKTAEKYKVYVVGNYSDAHQFAPTKWLTGNCFNWGPYYAQVCKSVIDHTWTKTTGVCDLNNGFDKLSSFGSAVPQKVKDEALQVKKKIETGQLTVFQGPVTDRNGKVHLAAGKKPDINWILNLDFFVPGIDGSLPTK